MAFCQSQSEHKRIQTGSGEAAPSMSAACITEHAKTFKTVSTEYDLPGSEYASVQFCHNPSPVNRLLWGRGFNRPFVSSLPGRRLRRCGPHDNSRRGFMQQYSYLGRRVKGRRFLSEHTERKYIIHLHFTNTD